MNLDRRRFLYTSAAALGLPRLSFGQAPQTTNITDIVSVISGAGNNVTMLRGSEGALLVDCGDAAHAREVARIAGTVKTVFNTHWHPDSTGGNDEMARYKGAKLVSHVHTQLWMTQEIIHDWEKKTYPKRPKEAQPTEVFYEDGKMSFGGETVEYGLLPLAHTDGDIFVHFTRANVLVVGDAVQPGRLPELDWFCGGWIGGMQTAHRTLLGRADDATKIVPARGPVMTKAELQASLDLITKVREKLVGLMKKGKGAQDWIDEKAADEFLPELKGDPAVFLYTAYRGLWAHARELGGIV